MTVIETILAGIIIAVISAFLGKLWGEHSRISIDQCLSARKLCHDELLNKLSSHEVRLGEGAIEFKSTRQYRKAVILTLQSICSKVEVDCDALNKAYLDLDVIG